MLSRRSFLNGTVAAGASALAGAGVASATAVPEERWIGPIPLECWVDHGGPAQPVKNSDVRYDYLRQSVWVRFNAAPDPWASAFRVWRMSAE
jgi:hypothetical protein